jgi:ABC-type antimicrobial peptide transport system permease subunit
MGSTSARDAAPSGTGPWTWHRPVAALARAELRGRRASMAVVVVVAALVSGAALTSAAGARRTATVVDRMLAQTSLPEYAIGTYLTTDAGDADLLAAAEDELERLPGVDRAIATANIYVAVGPGDGSWYLAIGTNLDGRYLESGWTAPLRDGRLPAVDGTGEVAFDAGTASRLGLEVGDEFVAPTISAETTEALLRGQTTEVVPDGPDIPLTVVGIFRESITDDPSFGWGVTSPDTAAFLGRAGVSEAYFLFDGDEDVDVQAAVDVVSNALGGGAAYVSDPDLELGPIRNTVDIIAAGLALFALLATVAGLIALGQVVGRQVADNVRIASVTRALGMRDRETAAALAIPPALAGAVGVVVGAVAAVALSPIFPTGIGRLAEPDPGVRIDWLVLGVGSLVLIAFVSTSAAVTAHRRVGAHQESGRSVVHGRGSGLRRGIPLTAAIGSGLVLVPNRIRTSVRPASALLGAVLGVAGVLAIAVFTVSQRTTAEDPARYGWVWDVDADIAIDDPEPLFAALAEEPALAAVGTAICGRSAVGDDDTVMCAMDVLSGSMPMTYLAGRAPASPDEVAVGQQTMASHDVRIGDRLEVTGASGVTKGLQVVGVAVFPDTSAPGSGLIATPGGLDALGGSDDVPILTLKYAPDLEQGEVERILTEEYGLSPDELTRASPPLLVERLDLVRPTLVALGLFLGVLAVIGLLHFLMLSNSRRRGETAVFAAIGFVRSQRVAVVVWQALTIAAIGIVVGAPLGLMIGRLVWQESIDQLGIVDTATIPWAFCVVIGAATLVGASAVGALTGWNSARRDTAEALRSE